MGFTINLSSLRYYLKNPMQLILSIVGVALGVGVVVSIDLANESAYEAFKLSMRSVSGNATHYISGGPNGFSDSVYRQLKVDIGFRKAAPVVEKFIRIQDGKFGVVTLMGIDPFAEQGFRNYVNASKFNLTGALGDFIMSENAVIIPKDLANELNKSIGDTIIAESDGKIFTMSIAGIIEPDESSIDLKNFVFTDISTAQHLLGMGSLISRIDLILPEENEKQLLSKLEQNLPEYININPSAARSKAGSGMTESFRINLAAMSLLALIVGIFLIYNTMTFAVVRRRRYIGLLRSLGVTGKEIYYLVLREAFIIGLIGTFLGIAIGIQLGYFMTNLVTKVINDMYFVLQVQTVEISSLSLLKGMLLGLAATVIAALKPAHEAGKVPAGMALARSSQEKKLKSQISKYNVLGIIIFLSAIPILFIETDSIYLTYLGVIPVILGFSLLIPQFIITIVAIIKPIVSKLFGTIGSMASRSIVTQLSRTTIAVAALCVAVSAAIGIGTMVKSFRNTVDDWLQFRLKADIYASVPTNVSRFNDGSFSREVANRILELDEVRAMNLYREYQLNDGGRIYHLLAAQVQSFEHEQFKTEGGISMDELWDKFQNENSIIMSESYAFKNKVEVGDTLSLATDKGRVTFNIDGLYYDYSSDIGLLMLGMNTYLKHFNDEMLSGIAVFAKEGVNIDSLERKIRIVAGDDIEFLVRSNKRLIEGSIEIFDRTFIITNVLQLLAISVAFIGILSALMALQLERAREFGVLRSIGMTPAQLRKLVILQTGIMGFIAAIAALPLGNILAYILVTVVNKRSFGWTVNFEFIPEYMLQGFVVSILASVLAGIYPAIKLSQSSPANSLREE
jgi:putative ABC transport system permease protein